ncbi:MAG: N-acetyl-gamma-glutamyl-phosphate reductase [Myxococcota bacterium]|jgi:N-acetyl-gamma-glutamyl-phosphate reductase
MTSQTKTNTRVRSVALIGARGHTGAELIALLSDHPHFELRLVTSRALAGQRVDGIHSGAPAGLCFENVDPSVVGIRGIDVWVLALPNGLSAPWVEAIDANSLKADQKSAIIVDLSGDHRFDENWIYGLPEARRRTLVNATRIANPGCYATGAQLVLLPMVDLLEGAPNVFGVSGYSGAGTTPSPKNDPEQLRDNLMPYALTGHGHELEVRWQLGHPVYFMPHVASFFRGITLTVSMQLSRPLDVEEVLDRYRARYEFEPLVEVTKDMPLVQAAAGRHVCTIGGVHVEATEAHIVVVATLDNLLKGAATQALQNMNLACGFDELSGIRSLL